MARCHCRLFWRHDEPTGFLYCHLGVSNPPAPFQRIDWCGELGRPGVYSDVGLNAGALWSDLRHDWAQTHLHLRFHAFPRGFGGLRIVTLAHRVGRQSHHPSHRRSHAPGKLCGHCGARRCQKGSNQGIGVSSNGAGRRLSAWPDNWWTHSRRGFLALALLGQYPSRFDWHAPGVLVHPSKSTLSRERTT